MKIGSHFLSYIGLCGSINLKGDEVRPLADQGHCMHQYEVYQLCPVFTTSEILVIICYYALRLSWLQFSPLGKAKNQTVEDCFKLMQVQANVKMDDDDSDPLPHLGTNMCAVV